MKDKITGKGVQGTRTAALWAAWDRDEIIFRDDHEDAIAAAHKAGRASMFKEFETLAKRT